MSGVRRAMPAWTGPGPVAPADPAAIRLPAVLRRPVLPARAGGTFTGFLPTARQSFWNCYQGMAKPPACGPGMVLLGHAGGAGPRVAWYQGLLRIRSAMEVS